MFGIQSISNNRFIQFLTRRIEDLEDNFYTNRELTHAFRTRADLRSYQADGSYAESPDEIRLTAQAHEIAKVADDVKFLEAATGISMNDF